MCHCGVSCFHIQACNIITGRRRVVQERVKMNWNNIGGGGKDGKV